VLVQVSSAGVIANVDSLRTTVMNNGQQAIVPITIPTHPFTLSASSMQSFALQFDPSRTGAVTVAVAALDAKGTVLASGTADGTITPGEDTTIDVVLPGLAAGDMSMPNNPDLSQQPSGCDGGTVMCNGKCISVDGDLNNCGACGNVCPTVPGATASCTAGRCGLDTDVSQNLIWSATSASPCLAFWKDGTLLTVNDGNQTAFNLSWDGQNVKSVASPGPLASRPSLYIPPNGPGEFVLSHYNSYYALDENFGQVWVNGLYGCCGTTPWGFPIDPIMGVIYANELATIDAKTGNTILSPGKNPTSVYIDPTHIYAASFIDNTVVRRSRADLSQTWMVSIGPSSSNPLDTPGAIASDGSLVVTSAKGNLLARVQPNSAKWEQTVENPTVPVVTADDLIILGEGGVNQPVALSAYKLSDGSRLWTQPIQARVVDVLVATGGLLYVSQKDETTVTAFAAADGTPLETYRNVGAPLEMLLRGGMLYTVSGGKVTVFRVTQTGYDPKSPWPVRYHDNQRTSASTASLAY
jgi:hypothetical protein